MAELKTTPNDGDVEAFLAGIEDEQKRADALELREMLSALSGEPAKMWGPSIVGFGSHRYRYESGREGDWFQIGFSPRKRNLTLYIMDGFKEYDDLLGRLGKHSTGKSCLYVNRLSDIDREVLRELATRSIEHAAATGA